MVGISMTNCAPLPKPSLLGEDLSAVHLDHGLADGQAKPESFARSPGLLESVENFSEKLGLDSGA